MNEMRDIQFTGDGIEITEAIKEYVRKRLTHLRPYFTRIIRMHFTFQVEKAVHQAEATIDVPHSNPLHAHANSEDIYHSIDLLIDKLEKLLKKYKEKITNHRD